MLHNNVIEKSRFRPLDDTEIALVSGGYLYENDGYGYGGAGNIGGAYGTDLDIRNAFLDNPVLYDNLMYDLGGYDNHIVVTGTLSQGLLLGNGWYLKDWDDGVTTVFDPATGTLTEVVPGSSNDHDFAFTVSGGQTYVSGDGSTTYTSGSSGSVTFYYSIVGR